MPSAERLIHGAVETGKQALAKAGVLTSPVRDAGTATRSLTVGRPLAEVRAFWADPAQRARAFATGAAGGMVAGPRGGDPSASGDVVRFDLPDGGRATVQLKVAPGDLGTEVRLTVDVGTVVADGRPRIGATAATLCLRALHGAKALMEVGEAPTLTANPAGRTDPDPYATTGPDATTTGEVADPGPPPGGLSDTAPGREEAR